MASSKTQRHRGLFMTGLEEEKFVWPAFERVEPGTMEENHKLRISKIAAIPCHIPGSHM